VCLTLHECLSSQGTDVTEAFEVFHINDRPSQVLKKFYVREAKEARNYRLSFDEDGFFKTLRRRCLEKLKTVDVKAYEWRSKLIFDTFLLGLLVAASLAVILVERNVKFVAAVAAGVFACFLVNGGHNFIHKKNSWRMYGCHAVLVNFKEFRVFHAMVSACCCLFVVLVTHFHSTPQSHHLYPNSIYDLETSIYEPFFKYMPVAKSPLRILMNYLFVPLVYMFGFHGAFAYR
jgi:hypothetical protein